MTTMTQIKSSDPLASEILISESTRDYGFIITTVTINGIVHAVSRLEKQPYKRMKQFCPTAWEDFQFNLVNEALNNYFKGINYAGY